MTLELQILYFLQKKSEPLFHLKLLVGIRDRPLLFYQGGYHFYDLQTIFLKSNAFQTIFFITFCNENNFFTTIFKKRYRLFYRSCLKNKTLLVHAYT